MRWMWIDRIVELVPGEKLVAIKHISLAEEHIHDHFPATVNRKPMPIMPMSLIVEGMAQTAGVLVGHSEGFKEKVVLAKVSKAEISREAPPGSTLRYTAEIDQLTAVGASTKGVVELIEPGSSAENAGSVEVIGTIDLLFSHLDNNMSGVQYPKENFVFSESFKTLMETSGIEADF
jgi:3-hydroxyacyl-[acyl-carrier-protein] dehydratase